MFGLTHYFKSRRDRHDQLYLSAISRLEPHATGLELLQAISQNTGHEPLLASVFGSLLTLRERGLISRHEYNDAMSRQSPPPGCFHLTESGKTHLAYLSSTTRQPQPWPTAADYIEASGWIGLA